MATGAERPNNGVMNYTKRGSGVGTPVIDGGMNTSIAGTRNEIGMITITTTAESSSAACSVVPQLLQNHCRL